MSCQGASGASFPGQIAIDLTKPGEVLYAVNSADCIWLPKVVVVNGKVIVNPTDAVVAIRVNETTGDQLPWAIQDGYVNRISGTITKLYVTVLTKGAGSVLYLETGIGANGSYASLDGLSPTFVTGKAGASCISIQSRGGALPRAIRTLDTNYIYPRSGGVDAQKPYASLQGTDGHWYEDDAHWKAAFAFGSRGEGDGFITEPDGYKHQAFGDSDTGAPIDPSTKNPFRIGVTPGVSQYLYNAQGTVIHG